MSFNYYNETDAYWARQQYEDLVDGLELTVAYSALTEPAADTIATWDNQGTGIYPLTTNRGATKATTIKVIDSDMSQVESIDYDPVAANPGGANTVWVNSSDSDKLYYGATEISTGGASGDVVGPASSILNGLPVFADTSGKLLADSALKLSKGTAADNVLLTEAVVPASTALRNVVIGPNLTGSSLDAGVSNVFIGSNAGYTNDGQSNTVIGTNAMQTATSNSNTVIGFSAGIAMTTGQDNLAIGANAGNAYTTQSNNIHIASPGISTDADVIKCGNSSSKHIAIGNHSAVNLAGSSEATTICGQNILTTQLTSGGIIAFGHDIANSATVAGSNLFIGAYVANSALIGNGNNTFIGNRVAQDASTFQGYNTFIGYQAAKNPVSLPDSAIVLSAGNTVLNPTKSNACFINQIYQKTLTGGLSTGEVCLIDSAHQIASYSQLDVRNNYTVAVVNSAGPYAVLSTDEYVLVDYTATAAITITLPAASAGKRRITVSDSGNNALVNNITINSASSIVGASTIATNAGAITYISDVANNRWIVVSVI